MAKFLYMDLQVRVNILVCQNLNIIQKEKTLKPMPSFPLPQNPKLGCTLYDDIRRIWVVWNGDEWVDVILNEHRCNLDNEKHIQD